MSGVDLSQCKQVYASKSSMVYSIATLLLTGGLAIIAQFTITPLLDEKNEDELENCPKKQDLKDSLKTFILISSIATFASLFLNVVIELYSAYVFSKHGKDIAKLSSKLAAVFQVATSIKFAFLVGAVYSVFIAYRAYPQCEKFKVESIKKQISKKLDESMASLNVRAIPRTFSMLRS
jgi:ABC-type uncharacterized transport system YnjBCD permease subunit